MPGRYARRIVLFSFLFSSTPAIAQHIDSVWVGSQSLVGARLRLGTESVKSFQLADGVRTPNSTTSRTTSLERHAGTDVYVMRYVHASADGNTTTSTMVVRASDFALVRHKVTADTDSAAVTASDGQITGWVVLPENPVQLLDVQIGHPVYPIEGQIPWLFPMLPLREGYRAAIAHFSQWSGTEEWADVIVIGSERIQFGRRIVDCWRVDTGELGPPGYRGYHWVAKEDRRVLQSVLRGTQDGVEYWAVALPPGTLP